MLFTGPGFSHAVCLVFVQLFVAEQGDRGADRDLCHPVLCYHARSLKLLKSLFSPEPLYTDNSLILRRTDSRKCVADRELTCPALLCTGSSLIPRRPDARECAAGHHQRDTLSKPRCRRSQVAPQPVTPILSHSFRDTMWKSLDTRDVPQTPQMDL